MAKLLCPDCREEYAAMHMMTICTKCLAALEGQAEPTQESPEGEEKPPPLETTTHAPPRDVPTQPAPIPDTRAFDEQRRRRRAAR
jgi:hypothetical protein